MVSASGRGDLGHGIGLDHRAGTDFQDMFKDKWLGDLELSHYMTCWGDVECFLREVGHCFFTFSIVLLLHIVVFRQDIQALSILYSFIGFLTSFNSMNNDWRGLRTVPGIK